MNWNDIIKYGATILNSIGQIQSAFGAASAYQLSSDLYNLQGQGLIANAEYAARRYGEQGQRFIATQYARFAKSGVRLEGTPALALADSEKNLRIDLLAIKLNAAAKANELGFAGLNQRLLSMGAKVSGYQALSSGLLKIGSSFLLESKSMDNNKQNKIQSDINKIESIVQG